MADRRKFLQVSMAASAWAFIGQSKASPQIINITNEDDLSYYKFVFDENIPASVQAADFMTKQSIATYGMRNGDITPFWFNELDAVWHQAPVPIAGMTAEGPLFCLEILAQQHGMRVIYRAEHSVNSDMPQNTLEKPLYSWVIAPAKKLV